MGHDGICFTNNTGLVSDISVKNSESCLHNCKGYIGLNILQILFAHNISISTSIALSVLGLTRATRCDQAVIAKEKDLQKAFGTLDLPEHSGKMLPKWASDPKSR